MADQIKQIYAGTAYIGQLSDGVAIASTNATTQNTIKDITVQNNTVLSGLGINTNFVVNGFTEANLNLSVTGSEYIDVSSTAVASATASFTSATFENWMNTGLANSRINSFDVRRVNSATASSVVTQSASISTAPAGAGNTMSWETVGSNFYHWTSNGGTGQALYRRTGGINGTETAVPNIASNNPVVFNGVDKFHWITTTQVYTHDTTTNTNTAVSLDASTGWAGIVGSNPRTAFANGLIFHVCSNNLRVCWVVNPTTGKMGSISLALGADPAASTAFDVFMSGGNYYILSTASVGGGSTGNMYVMTIPVATIGALTSTNTSGTATSIYSSSSYTPSVALSSHWPKLNSNGDFVFLSFETSGSIFVYKMFNVVTLTFGSSVSVDVSSASPNTTAASLAPFRMLSPLINDSANKNNTTYYPQSISLRVTGVQTTL